MHTDTHTHHTHARTHARTHTHTHIHTHTLTRTHANHSRARSHIRTHTRTHTHTHTLIHRYARACAQTDRQTDRQTETDRDRQTETNRQTQRKREERLRGGGVQRNTLQTGSAFSGHRHALSQTLRYDVMTNPCSIGPNDPSANNSSPSSVTYIAILTWRYNNTHLIAI